MSNKNKNNSSSMGFGILVIGMGIILLLNNLDVKIFNREVWAFWPSLLILLGLWQLAIRASLFGALITVFIGGFWQLHSLDKLPENIGAILWPTILIIIGLKIIFNRPKLQSEENSKGITIFGGANIKNTSENFQGAELAAVFGGLKIDLREAKLNNNATISATTFCGGIEILVPENWKLNIKGLPILGGWDNKTNQTLSEDSKTLTINLVTIMGGVDIKN